MTGFKRSAEVGARFVIEQKAASYLKGHDDIAAEAKAAAAQADAEVNTAHAQYIEKLKTDQAAALTKAEAEGQVKAKTQNCDAATAEFNRLKAILDKQYSDIGEFGYQVAVTSISQMLKVSSHICEIR